MTPHHALRASFVLCVAPLLLAWVDDGSAPTPPSVAPFYTIDTTYSPTRKLELQESLQGTEFGVALDSAWVDNPTRAPVRLAQRDMALVLRPSLRTQVYSDRGFESDWRLVALGTVDYHYFAGVDDAVTRDYSGLFGLGEVGYALRLDKAYELGAVLRAERSAEPDRHDLAQTQRTPRWYVHPALVAAHRSEGGALRLEARYALALNDYEAAELDPFTHLQHVPAASLVWQATSKVRLEADTAATFTRYRLARGNQPATLAHGDTNLLAASFRLATSVSKYFEVRGGMGVASGYAKNVRDTSALTAALRLGYNSGALARVYLEAERAMLPASVFSFVTLNEGRLGVLLDFAQHTKLDVALRYGVLVFAGSDKLSNERRDARTLLDATLGHEFDEHFEVAVVQRLEVRRTNFVSAVGDPSYRRSETVVRGEWKY